MSNQNLELTYKEVDSILYPVFELLQQSGPIGMYGRMRRKYLIDHKPVLLNQLVVTGRLFEHLAQINREATELLDRLIAQMKKAEGVTEELKGRDQMAWVGRMNNIKARAEEIVLAEIVYYDAYD
ncbi:MAG: TnpV protein [Clostridia bacterium]|nr:TnpV protein [Clostridia bacterium]